MLIWQTLFFKNNNNNNNSCSFCLKPSSCLIFTDTMAKSRILLNNGNTDAELCGAASNQVGSCAVQAHKSKGQRRMCEINDWAAKQRATMEEH